MSDYLWLKSSLFWLTVINLLNLCLKSDLLKTNFPIINKVKDWIKFKIFFTFVNIYLFVGLQGADDDDAEDDDDEDDDDDDEDDSEDEDEDEDTEEEEKETEKKKWGKDRKIAKEKRKI